MDVGRRAGSQFRQGTDYALEVLQGHHRKDCAHVREAAGFVGILFAARRVRVCANF